MSEETALNYLLLNSIITEMGCREWTGPVTRDGYGQIGSEKVFREFGIKGAHRLMVHLFGHEFAGRHEQVMHLCHNRRCIAQEHLRVGTAKENIAMALERGSHVGGKKLSHSDVLMIRALDALLAGRRWIAARFGVDETIIQKIATGKVWAKVTHEPDFSLAEMQAAAAAMIAEAESLAEIVRTRRFTRKAVL